jgi:hypothetical protein
LLRPCIPPSCTALKSITVPCFPPSGPTGTQSAGCGYGTTVGDVSGHSTQASASYCTFTSNTPKLVDVGVGVAVPVAVGLAVILGVGVFVSVVVGVGVLVAVLVGVLVTVAVFVGV